MSVSVTQQPIPSTTSSNQQQTSQIPNALLSRVDTVSSVISSPDSTISSISSVTFTARTQQKQQEASKEPSPLPPLDENFARTLTDLRESVRKSADPRIQLAFVRYLFEAAEVIESGDAARLGLQVANTSTNTANPVDALEKMHELLVEEALRWLKKLALGTTASASSGSLNNNSNFNFNGNTGQMSTTARQAIAEAQFMLAEAFGKGSWGLCIDHKRAFALYVHASKQGHAEAAFRVAVCHEVGAGTKRDGERAAQFYRKAAAMGNPLAMHKMARVLLHGRLGQTASPKEGLKWLKRAAAHADVGHPEALFDLGLCFAKETALVPIVLPDDIYAFSLFKQAADLGYAPAQFRVATLLEFGVTVPEVSEDSHIHHHHHNNNNRHLEVPQIDIPEAINYYRQAAEQGHPEAQLALASWCLQGCPEAGLPASESDAFRWAQRAALDGSLMRAEHMLAHFYDNGIGCVSNKLLAKEFYGKAAEKGYQRSKSRLEEIAREEAAAAGNQRSRKGKCAACCAIQ